jgi:hypothetical protein
VSSFPQSATHRRLIRPGLIHRVLDAVEPMLAVDDRRKLPDLGVFGNVRFGMCGDDEDARYRIAIVPDLVTAFRPERKWEDIAFL